MPTESIPRQLLVEVRRGDYTRAGQIDAKDVRDLTCTLRLNNLGAWSITLPETAAAAAELRVPGAGIVVTLDDDVLLSGPLVAGELKQRQGEVDTWTFEGIDDGWVIADALAWPNPGVPSVALQPGTANTGYDLRDGPAETLMRAYVSANVGPLAVGSRKVPVLDLAPDLGRGPSVRGSARFTPMGELLSGLATIAGLTFRVRANGDRLLFEVGTRTDRTALVRFDVDNDTADEASYRFEAPGLTRAIVAGQGEGVQRLFVSRSSTASLAAEALWGRRRERFVDRRDTTEEAVLVQAGDEALADEGRTRVGVKISPVDTAAVRFWRDWRIGDTASATIGDVTLQDVISEATATYGPDGLQVKAVLGDPSVAAQNTVVQLLEEQRRIKTRTGRLERQ